VRGLRALWSITLPFSVLADERFRAGPRMLRHFLYSGEAGASGSVLLRAVHGRRVLGHVAVIAGHAFAHWRPSATLFLGRLLFSMGLISGACVSALGRLLEECKCKVPQLRFSVVVEL
jgi:hypothetical protein